MAAKVPQEGNSFTSLRSQAFRCKCPLPICRKARYSRSITIPLVLTRLSVTKLNDVRDDNATYNNRIDTTLADVFSLLSLFYLTIGKTRDTPAIYCQIASMKVSSSARRLPTPFSI